MASWTASRLTRSPASSLTGKFPRNCFSLKEISRRLKLRMILKRNIAETKISYDKVSRTIIQSFTKKLTTKRKRGDRSRPSQPTESPEGIHNSPLISSRWVVSVLLAIWRARLHLVNVMHSRLVLIAFSFEHWLQFLLFRLDWSYHGNFEIKTAKTCFLI